MAKSFTKAAFLVSFGSIISLGFGIIRQMVIAYLFGAGREMDAFFTSIVIPVYITSLFLAGINFVLIPAFIQEEEAGHKEDAWALVGTALVIIFIFFSVISVLIMIYASDIIGILAPEMADGKQKLTASLLQIQILALPFMGLGSMASGVRNTQGSYLGPALAPAVGTMGNLIVILFLFNSLGIISLAWGWFFAYLIQGMLNFIPVSRYSTKRFLPLFDPRFVELGRLIAPFLIFGVLQRSTKLIERYFASGFSDGQISYLGYADRIGQLMVVFVGTGIATAILPAMSRSWNKDGRVGLANVTERGLTITMAVVIPIIVFFFSFGEPFVDIFLGRGKFDEITIAAVGSILGLTAIVTAELMIGNVLGRGFYTMKITWFTPLIGSIMVIFYVFLANYLSKEMQYIGLITANVIMTGMSIVIMISVTMIILREYFIKFWKLTVVLFFFGIVVHYLIDQITSTWNQKPITDMMFGFVFISIIFSTLYYLFDKELVNELFELFGLKQVKRLGSMLFRSRT